MRFTKKLTLLLAVLSICAFSAGSAADRKFEKKFSVTPGGTLVLKTDIGSVKVSGTSSDEVTIVADIHGRDKMVEGFEIIAEESKDGVSVRGRGREHGSWFFNTWEGIDVEFTVKVPRKYNLRVETAGGNMSVEDVSGRIDARTSGGDVQASAVEGALELHTSGGGVKAERVTGDANLETSGGDVHATDVKGNVDASTSGGNVRISGVEGSVRAETSGGDVSVNVKGPNKGVHAETSGGNIDIVIAKNQGAMIDASTSGGEVVCDMPVTVSGRISSDRVRGTVNGGGATIYAHTSGGDVRIRAID